MNGLDFTTESKFGILGGTLLSAIVNIPGEELFNAVVLATVGAISSFAATLICKKLVAFFRKKYNSKR